MTTGCRKDPFLPCLHRTIALVGEEPVESLRTKTVAIGGCGGLGGAACLTLARMGVGGFTLADPGVFDEPDINRQWCANHETLGRNKAEVYAEALRAINPDVKVRLHTEGVQDDNVQAFVAGADLLIDCLDMRVPVARRSRMFEVARGQGIYSITAPVLGFGCAVVVSAPDGMPMVAVGGMIDRASEASVLPELLRDIFVPEHVDAMERLMPEHRVPSVAPGPSLANALVCTEALLILAGATVPGWRPPLCLPQLFAVDMVRMNYRIVNMAEFLQRMAAPRARATRVAPATADVSPASAPGGWAAVLEQVGWNTNLLPHEVVPVDLLTDSWSEIHAPPPRRAPAEEGTYGPGRCEQAIQGLYGYRHVMPVFRGRFAEAILGKAIARPGTAIACNALFPSTRFHLESNGATLVDVGVPEASNTLGGHPFKGDIDLDRLRQALADSKVRAVYVELAVNATGGHPISLANLRALREATRAAQIPLALDATRAFENAALLREREEGLAGRSLIGLVREMCSHSDACATSLTKDFPASSGAFIGVNQPDLFQRLCDLRLAFGDGFAEEARSALCGSLAVAPEDPQGALGRVRQVHRLWLALRSLGVSVVEPAGGHAVFVDAAALLPHLAPGQFAAHAVCGAVYALAGVRGGVSFLSPHHEQAQAQIVRFAVPVFRYADADLDRLVVGFKWLLEMKASVPGLARVGGPAGAVGRFASTYRPLARPGYCSGGA